MLFDAVQKAELLYRFDYKLKITKDTIGIALTDHQTEDVLRNARETFIRDCIDIFKYFLEYGFKSRAPKS